MKINKSDIKSIIDFIEKEEINFKILDTSPYKLIEDIKLKLTNLV